MPPSGTRGSNGAAYPMQTHSLCAPMPPMPYSASLILSGEGGPTRFSLFFEETFSD